MRIDIREYICKYTLEIKIYIRIYFRIKSVTVGMRVCIGFTFQKLIDYVN